MHRSEGLGLLTMTTQTAFGGITRGHAFFAASVLLKLS